MTSIKAREGRQGKEREGKKWHDGAKDRGSIVTVLTGRWQVRGLEDERERERGGRRNGMGDL